MLQIGNLSNAMQKRLIRPLYAHTQATPYAATLDASLRNADGSFRAPLSTDTNPATRSAAAFLLQGGLVPGTVMIRNIGEACAVATGADVATERPFGLLANFVGGTLDDLKTNNEIGVWRGPDSVWELLYPAFNPTGMAAAYASATAGTGPVGLYAGTDGRLSITAGTNRIRVADLIEYSPAKIVIDLKV